MAYLGRNITTTNIIVLFAIFVVVYSVYFNTQTYFFSSASFPDLSNLPNGNIQDMNRRSMTKMEGSLARARAAIYKTARMKRQRHYVAEQIVTSIPTGPVYRNPQAFLQSYKEMEKRFKVWVYKEGEPPLFHSAPAKNLYSIEGQFIDELENRGESSYLAHSPDKAVVFFLPLGITNIRK